MLQGLSAADRLVDPLVPLGEVGLDAHQEHRHAGNDRQVGEEDRQVVEDRGAQRADHQVRGGGVEPEDELVDPDPQVVAEAGQQQTDEDLPAVEEVEGHHAPGRVLAEDVVEEDEQQAGVADQQCQQQAVHLHETQQVGTGDHQRVADEHHQQDAFVGLHSRQEDDHQPQVAEHHEVGHHQQAVGERLIEQGRQQYRREQARRQRHQQQHAHQVGQDRLVLALEQAIGNEAGEEQLQSPVKISDSAIR